MKQKKKKESVWRPDRISRAEEKETGDGGAEENGLEQERSETGYAVIVFVFVSISRPYPAIFRLYHIHFLSLLLPVLIIQLVLNKNTVGDFE